MEKKAETRPARSRSPYTYGKSGKRLPVQSGFFSETSIRDNSPLFATIIGLKICLTGQGRGDSNGEVLSQGLDRSGKERFVISNRGIGRI
jgi:hypothetical protein